MMFQTYELVRCSYLWLRFFNPIDHYPLSFPNQRKSLKIDSDVTV